MNPDQPQLAVNAIDVGYGRQTIVKQAGFTLQAGEIACLLGPSGCGKSTLLRAIAGFEPVRAGEIMLNGRSVSRPGRQVPPEKRRVGMVFQDFALFPHLSIEKNIAFGLRSLSRTEQKHRIDRLLELVGLNDLRHAYPHQLSGGQQQRIALIRALAPRPEVLLLDEPFSSMDVELREQLALEVRTLLKEEGVTAILVTHDQMEAFAFADSIGVLKAGRLLQWGTPYQLYHAPAERFVAEFVGQGVLLPGTVAQTHKITTDLGAFRCEAALTPGKPVHILIRPDDVLYDKLSEVRGEIIEKRFRGAEYLYTLRLAGGSEVFCLVPSHHHHHELHEKIGIHLDMEHVVVFDSA